MGNPDRKVYVVFFPHTVSLLAHPIADGLPSVPFPLLSGCQYALPQSSGLWDYVSEKLSSPPILTWKKDHSIILIGCQGRMSNLPIAGNSTAQSWHPGSLAISKLTAGQLHVSSEPSLEPRKKGFPPEGEIPSRRREI